MAGKCLLRRRTADFRHTAITITPCFGGEDLPYIDFELSIPPELHYWRASLSR